MSDPYYNRKPVPKEFVQDVGVTGLDPEQEYQNRERKFSANGDDVRKFSSKLEPKNDPYYSRKRVDASITKGVGDSGLTPDEEYLTRERKFSANGDDVRKFSTKLLEPQNDPYYARKQTHKAQIAGVGVSGLTPAEEFETRERKQSVAQVSSDPFDALANRPRASIAAQGGQYAIAEQRRASQVGMGSLGGAAGGASVPGQASHSAMHKPANDAHFKGYTGFGGSEGDKLAPIESRAEGEVPPVAAVGNNTTTTATATGVTDGTIGTGTGSGVDAATGHASGHTGFYDQATGHTGRHADEIGPTDVVHNGTANTTTGGAGTTSTTTGVA